MLALLYKILYKIYRIVRYCFYFTLLSFINFLIFLKLFYEALITKFLIPLIKEYLRYWCFYSFFIVLDSLIFILTPYANFIAYLAIELIRFLLKLLENLCFIHYLIWEVANFKRHKRQLCFLLYLVSLMCLWFLYWGIFIPAWYEGLCCCCDYQGEARCGQMYFCLTYVSFFFLEAYRALKYFLREYFTNAKDGDDDDD